MPTEPTTFTRVGPNGQKQTRLAYTADEAVRLRFEGWAEQPTTPTEPAPEPGPDPVAEAMNRAKPAKTTK